jgi:2-polyprenyl-3-methyl-5-hydroxy-6-metoxy-1,4-benzoquinol methylase
MEGVNKSYYYGKGSNYFFGYDLLRYKIMWIGKIRQLLKYKKGGKVLDVGCAFGYFAFHMKSIGFDVYGIDVSKYAIEKCKKNLTSNNFFVNDASNKFPFKKEFFDIITAFDVIEHVKEYKIALKNIVSTLKNDGIFLLQTPLKIKNKFLKKIAIDRDKTHISILSEEEIEVLLKNYNLKFLKKKYYLNLFSLITVPTIKKFATNILIVSKKEN